MKKALTLLLSLSLMAALLAGCGGGNGSSSQPQPADNSEATTSQTEAGGDAGSSGEGTLNLYTWEGMFSQELRDAYEAQTGYKINYVVFDTDETMLAQLERSQGGDYDLIIADDYIIEIAIAEGLVQELDTGRLANYGNINPEYKGLFYDPSDAYTVPLGAGIQTIAYNPANVDMEITGYADLWDESLRDNIGIITNFRVINGMALKVNGESYNTEDLDAIQAAGDKLLELAPNIRLMKDDNLQDDLVSGEVDVAVMYTSQVTMAMLANPELEFVYPSEGIGFGVMAGFIPSQAPNSDAAYAFIDFLLEGENAAEYFMWLGYYSTISAADEFIPEDIRELLTLPASIRIEDTEMIQLVGSEAEALHSDIWTTFRTATGQ